MAQWKTSVTIRAGATPLTFDGNQTFRFNGEGTRVTGISLSHSLSVHTTDEGYALAVRLSENQGLPSKNPVFFMGHVAFASPATNRSVEYVPVDYMPVDIPIAPSSTMRLDITTIAGAVQTGTHDLRISLSYDKGDTPNDIRMQAAAKKGIVPVKGGTYGTLAALVTTVETELVGNGTTLNIPGDAKEIVAVCALQVIDTAVTASEELGGDIRFEFDGISDAGLQRYEFNGGVPNLGTEVDGGAIGVPFFLPMYLRNPQATELQVNGFVNALSAIGGGADYAVNLLWR